MALARGSNNMLGILSYTLLQQISSRVKNINERDKQMRIQARVLPKSGIFLCAFSFVGVYMDVRYVGLHRVSNSLSYIKYCDVN